MPPELVLRNAANLVHPAVRLELVAAVLVEHLPAERVGSALGDELDLHRAFGAGLGAEPRRRDGDFLDRAEPDGREHEHARAAAPEARGVVVDAVERDVDRAARQPVEVTVAASRALRRARHHQREIEDVAAAQRQLRNLLVRHGVRDRGRLGLDHRGPSFDVDLFGHAGHLELDDDLRVSRGLHHDLLQRQRPEPGGGRGQRVRPRLKIRKHEPAVVTALGLIGQARCRVDQHEVGFDDHRAGGVLDDADDLTGGAHLRGRQSGRKRDEKRYERSSPEPCHGTLPPVA